MPWGSAAFTSDFGLEQKRNDFEIFGSNGPVQRRGAIRQLLRSRSSGSERIKAMAAARSPSRAAAAIFASDAMAGIRTGETNQASRNPVNFRFIDRLPTGQAASDA